MDLPHSAQDSGFVGSFLLHSPAALVLSRVTFDNSLARLWGEGGEPVRLSAANGPEHSEGAQGKLREPG